MKLIDLTGQQFGNLTVIERDYDYQKSHSYDKPYWRCKCACGKIFSVNGKSLRENKTVSCGCLAKERAKNINFKDIIGQYFGKLTVLNYLGNSKWRCLCDCGTMTEVISTHLISGHTQSCGCLNSKGELYIRKWLKDKEINFIKEYTNKDLRNSRGNMIRIDFAIIKNNTPIYFIEYNGIQHYDKNDSWYKESIEDGMHHKIDYANKKHVPLIIIKYNDDISEVLSHIDFSKIEV